MTRELPNLTIVTGAAGWLGTALTIALADRPGTLRLGVLDDAEAERIAALAPNAEIVIGDLSAGDTAKRLLADAEGADVVHTAGIIHPKKVEQFEQVNVGGTTAVLKAAQAARARRLVHISSNSPFGVNPTPEDRFSAIEPYNPYMGYGRSKMRGEQLVLAAHGDRIETTVVRPPWFYGREQPARQTQFFTLVRTGKFPLVGNGKNRRSMVNTANLVQGVLLAELTEIAAGRAYWIADRRPYTMTEVVETVGEAMRLEGYEVKAGSRRLPNVAGTIAEKIDGVLQSRGRYVQELHVLGEMNKTIACRIDAAENDLGYDPQVELLGGMRDAIQWCQAQGIEL